MFEDLPKETLLKIIDVYAKSFQAIDGAYFLALEKQYGMDVAIEIDREAWKIFSPIEARRIVKEFDISPNGGLDSLEKALSFRINTRLNMHLIERPDDKTLILKMNECRIQVARKRKGLPDHPCKLVALIEYEVFTETIDPRIKTKCLVCPPDSHPEEYFCAWEFTLEE